MEIFRPHKLMFSAVKKIEEVEHDVQALANGYVAPFDFKEMGKVDIPGYPIQFSHSSAFTKSRAPKIGEHTDAVLAEAGYTPAQIESLRKDNIIK